MSKCDLLPRLGLREVTSTLPVGAHVPIAYPVQHPSTSLGMIGDWRPRSVFLKWPRFSGHFASNETETLTNLCYFVTV
jgi:hypothetical protein